jgi:hypothetical protein
MVTRNRMNVPKRCKVTVHAEHAFRHHEAVAMPAPLPREQALQVLHIIVAEGKDRCT